MTIMEFIKKEMEARGMTYENLAYTTGMSKQNVWDKLNKRVQPNFGTIKKILEGMDFELSVERRKGFTEPDADGVKKFFALVEDEAVSYDCIKSMLEMLGYDLVPKTQNIE